MTFVWILFTGWVLYFALRGYLQGIWRTLIGLIGFGVAYAVSAYWATDAGAVIQTFGLGSMPATIVGSAVLFILAYLIASTLPKIFLEKWLDKKSLAARLTGAGAGGTLGCFSGLVLIWAISFIGAAWQSGSGRALPSQLVVPKPLASAAGALVGSVAKAGTQAVGAKDIHAQLVGALLANPEEFVESFTSLQDSKVMDRFFLDGPAQFYMAKKDYAALRQTPAFKEVAQQEGVRSIGALALAGKEGDPEKVSQNEIDQTLAENMTFVWRRMEYLKHNPEVQSILSDPEVQQLVQNKNPLDLMFNAKVSRLVDLIMQDDPAMELHDFSQADGAGMAGLISQDNVEVVAPPKQVKIYKWVDDDGQVQYTDLDSTPKNKRAQAELLSAQGE